MKPALCTGGVIQCSFGTAPVPLNSTPTAKVLINGKPMATQADHIPIGNIPSFGLCSCVANPAVQAATAAAMGTPTSAPCVPVTTAPWQQVQKKVKVGGQPALQQGSRLTCQWGGQISVRFPGQMNVYL